MYWSGWATNKRMLKSTRYPKKRKECLDDTLSISGNMRFASSSSCVKVTAYVQSQFTSVQVQRYLALHGVLCTPQPLCNDIQTQNHRMDWCPCPSWGKVKSLIKTREGVADGQTCIWRSCYVLGYARMCGTSGFSLPDQKFYCCLEYIVNTSASRKAGLIEENDRQTARNIYNNVEDKLNQILSVCHSRTFLSTL